MSELFQYFHRDTYIWCSGVLFGIIGSKFYEYSKNLSYEKSNYERWCSCNTTSKNRQDILLETIRNQSVCIFGFCEILADSKGEKDNVDNEYKHHPNKIISKNKTDIHSPPITANLPADKDELSSLFEEEIAKKSSIILENPINIKPCQSAQRNGYITLSHLENENNKRHKTLEKIKTINRSEEIELLHSFEFLKGMKYSNAVDMAKDRGYRLHPIYINNISKKSEYEYSNNIVGISVEDKNYDFYSKKYSPNAVVSKIINIGGQNT